MDDDRLVPREQIHLITKTRTKCPKYNKGDDFVKYLVRFDFHCESNKIKREEKGTELFAHLKGAAFDSAILLPIADKRDYKDVVKQLTARFSPITGAWGDINALNVRMQSQFETTSEFIEALEILADRAGYKDYDKPLKVIEVFTKNVTDDAIKKDSIKIQLKSKHKERNPMITLDKIKQAIKNSETSEAIFNLNSTTKQAARLHTRTLQEPPHVLGNMEQKINFLTQKLNELTTVNEPQTTSYNFPKCNTKEQHNYPLNYNSSYFKSKPVEPTSNNYHLRFHNTNTAFRPRPHYFQSYSNNQSPKPCYHRRPTNNSQYRPTWRPNNNEYTNASNYYRGEQNGKYQQKNAEGRGVTLQTRSANNAS